jgi:hypothetical protein
MDSSGKKYVLEQVITTMASVADTSEEKFVPYYDYVMPFLKHVLVNANDPSLRLLRGKTIECISLIGLAVGADKASSISAKVHCVHLVSTRRRRNHASTIESSTDDWRW